LRELFLITGADCPLCEEAKDILDSVSLKDVIIIEKDIYSTRKIYDDFWDKIPVIMVEQKILCWPFNGEEIRNLVSR
tara:strand:+ start:129 stop:359 length:231 start_codon:yes stop_codon:yes gene_type:complete